MSDVPSKAQDDPISLPGPAVGEGGEKPSLRPDTQKLPKSDDKPGSPPAPRNPIFTDLVQGEEDLPGLVGYALYKLSKRDWLTAFVKTHGREPTQDEMESYILGEHTQRRIATYRRLAEELITRKTAVAEKPSPPPAVVPDTPPPRVAAGHSLRSSLAGEASNGTGVRPSSKTAVDDGRPRRSGATTLIFWLLVLLVIVAVVVYWNYPSVLRALTG